jgi:hypothetical protein
MRTRKQMLLDVLEELNTYPWWKRMGWTNYSRKVRWVLLQLAEIEAEEEVKDGIEGTPEASP